MRNFLASVAVLSTLTGAAFAQDANTVLATVNGTDITLGHLIAMQDRLPEQYQQLPDEVLFKGMLDQLIQQQALADAAQDDADMLTTLGLENEARAYLAGRVIDSAADAEISEEDLQAAYDAQFTGGDPETEFNASHILVETEEEAVALIAEIGDGADFAELAKVHSTGPSGPNGGALGWFGMGMMVPEFEAAVVALEPGAVTQAPVQTQFGWHVVKLNESRIKSAPALEEVRGDLEEELRAAAVDKAVADLTAAATVTRAEVAVDPALIRNLDLLSE